MITLLVDANLTLKGRSLTSECFQIVQSMRDLKLRDERRESKEPVSLETLIKHCHSCALSLGPMPAHASCTVKILCTETLFPEFSYQMLVALRRHAAIHIWSLCCRRKALLPDL